MPTDAADGCLVYASSSGLSDSFATSTPLDALAWLQNTSGSAGYYSFSGSSILSISMGGMKDSEAIRQIVDNMIAQEAIVFVSRIIDGGRDRETSAPEINRTLARGRINNAQSLSVNYAYAPSAVAISPIPETNAAVLAGFGSLIMFRRRRLEV